MKAPGLISWPMGAAVVGGVPALVLVSLGQISALAGSAAVLVWIASATLGLIMAFSFAQLARCFPGVTGGLGVLASYTHERDRPWLATATRWSYWLGWSPGLAVYSAVLANYALVLIDPNASRATAWLLSIAIIVVTTAINCRGISASASLQVALSITVLVLLLLLLGGASTRFSMASLLPMAPPAGWSTWQGVAAVAGALFLAGWTCYGAELAICLAAEYRRGTRDTLRCLSAVALVTFVVYAVVPALITGVIGSRGVEDDPARALLRLVPAALASIGPLLALGTVMAALILSVNMIVMTSSRVLLQVGRDEPAFAFLAKTKNGVPANALIFDGAANCLLLTACFVQRREERRRAGGPSLRGERGLLRDRHPCAPRNRRDRAAHARRTAPAMLLPRGRGVADPHQRAPSRLRRIRLGVAQHRYRMVGIPRHHGHSSHLERAECFEPGANRASLPGSCRFAGATPWLLKVVPLLTLRDTENSMKAPLAAALTLLLTPFCIADGVTFEAAYDATLHDIPPAAKRIHMWVPLPRSTAYQAVDSVAITSEYPWQQFTDPVYGNHYILITVENPVATSVAVRVAFRVTRHEARYGHWPNDTAEADDLSRALRADRYVTISPRIRALAAEITANARNDLERARDIYAYVTATMRYDKVVPGWGSGDTERACDVRAGNCTDIHSLFISLARAAGVPSRFVIGFPLRPDARAVESYHCWAEFYVAGLGWIPVDASDAIRSGDPDRRAFFFGNLDPHRVQFTVGRDVPLAPKTAQPLNYFIYPYAEADGQAVGCSLIRLTYQPAAVRSAAAE